MNKVLPLIGLVLCFYAPPTIAGSIQPTITMGSSVNPAVLGQALTLTATVSPPTASGKVTFYDGSTILGTRPIGSGQASLYTDLLASGVRLLRAYYSGDASYGPSTSVIFRQTINALDSMGFQSPINYNIGATAVATGDLNGDGKADLAAITTTGQGSGTLRVLLGNGDGNFQSAFNYNINGYPSAVAVGDFNGDGKADLAVSSITASTAAGIIGILLGNGDGTFQPAVNYSVGQGPISLAVADFNADGNADLAVADYDDANVNLLFGVGDGTFRPAGSYVLESWSTFIAAADFNGDGQSDLVVSHPLGGCCSFQANGEVSVLLGNGNGTFRPPADYLAGQVPVNNKPECVAVADFNGDGNADLVVADGNGFNVSILLGNGDGTFRPSVDYAVGGDAVYVAVGDFNGDGKSDLAVALGYNPSGTATGLSILLGNGDGTFQRPVSQGTTGSPTALVVGEFNGDGKTDLAVAASSLSILLGGLLPAPDLTIAKSHIGNFLQGPGTGTYSITVSNVGNASTFGTITVVDTLPNGLTAAAIGGMGWTCSITNATCSRADSLPVGASYPVISVTVNVAAGTAATVINTATVSGGGETNVANDIASDPTQISISLLSQIITLAPLSDQALGAPPFSLISSASSGLPVSFTSNTAAVCTISGTVVSLVSIGICSITATQNGNAVYAVATPVTQNFKVKTPQSIMFGPLGSVTLATHAFSANPTASSGLAVQLGSSTPLVCTVSGSVVTLLAAGTCTITATQSGNDSFAPALPVIQSFTVIGPTISGVFPVDSLLPAIQPGSWASIYGSNLASTIAVWNGDFPTCLGGTTVSINGTPAYLSYVSPTLINLQAPDDLTAGTVEAVVTNNTGSVTSFVVLAPVSPSFLLFDDGKHVAANIPTPNGTGAYAGGAYDVLGPAGAFAFNTRPVNIGEILVLYGVGFGPTSPAVQAGKPFLGAAPTIYQVSITLGGVPAEVQFAGIAESGLYQINVKVPNTASGDAALQGIINGVRTQPGPLVAVQ